MESLSEVQQTGTCNMLLLIEQNRTCNMLLLIEQHMLVACAVFVTCAI